MSHSKTIPPFNKMLSYPLLGSGKISRRIIIRPAYCKKKNKDNKFSQMIKNRVDDLDKVITKTGKKSIPFKTSSAKIIFYYWNGFGFPFVTHRAELNKTNSLAIHKINKNLSVHGKEKIISSIKTVHKVFSSKWFKYNFYFSSHKISLPSFFCFDTSKFRQICKVCPEMPHSWFKESMKGKEYLEEKYSLILKDKNPLITKHLTRVWKVYNKNVKIKIKDGNNLISCGCLINIFSKKNNLAPLALIDIIDGMLNKWKTYKPKHSAYLTNNIFWNEVFPKELVRYGIFKSLDEIKL